MRGRRATRRQLLAGAGGAFGSTLVGCLDENPGSDDPQLGEPETFVEIELTSASNGVHVDPPAVHLVEGGTAEWVVERGPHDVTAYHPSTHGGQQRVPDGTDPWASGKLSEDGESFDRVFDDEGVYDYVCTPHEAAGAVGTVLVGWPEPDAQPGLAPPDDEFPVAARERLERLNRRVRDVLETVHE